MRLEEAVNLLQAANVKVPYKVQQAVVEQSWGANGTVEIWICKKCPGFMYKAPIPCIDVYCKKDHRCTIMWHKPK